MHPALPQGPQYYSWEDGETTMQTVETILETLQQHSSVVAVHLLVLTGQNDADSYSRKSTRHAAETRASFKEFVALEIAALEQRMSRFPQVTIHWMKPFDKPDTEAFTPLYVELVQVLSNEINLRPHVVEVDTLDAFELDDYHLLLSGRTQLARQVVAWFDAL